MDASELHPAGMIHLRADNVVIHVERRTRFRNSGTSTEWPVNSMRSIGTPYPLWR